MQRLVDCVGSHYTLHTTLQSGELGAPTSVKRHVYDPHACRIARARVRKGLRREGFGTAYTLEANAMDAQRTNDIENGYCSHEDSCVIHSESNTSGCSEP